MEAQDLVPLKTTTALAMDTAVQAQDSAAVKPVTAVDTRAKDTNYVSKFRSTKLCKN